MSRFLQLVPLVVGVSVIAFAHLSQGTPTERKGESEILLQSSNTTGIDDPSSKDLCCCCCGYCLYCNSATGVTLDKHEKDFLMHESDESHNQLSDPELTEVEGICCCCCGYCLSCGSGGLPKLIPKVLEYEDA